MQNATVFCGMLQLPPSKLVNSRRVSLPDLSPYRICVLSDLCKVQRPRLILSRQVKLPTHSSCCGWPNTKNTTDEQRPMQAMNGKIHCSRASGKVRFGRVQNAANISANTWLTCTLTQSLKYTGVPIPFFPVLWFLHKRKRSSVVEPW